MQRPLFGVQVYLANSSGAVHWLVCALLPTTHPTQQTRPTQTKPKLTREHVADGPAAALADRARERLGEGLAFIPPRRQRLRHRLRGRLRLRGVVVGLGQRKAEGPGDGGGLLGVGVGGGLGDGLGGGAA
jgi:hypothetical protein